jgi:hypothetical protein
MPCEWRVRVNVKADELLYEPKLIALGGLAFAEVKQRSRFNGGIRPV